MAQTAGFLERESNGNLKFTPAAPGSGVDEFIDLTDTPASYVDKALYLLAVNAGETALEYTESLPGDTDALYARLLGRAGGQTLIGGTESGDDLTLESTSHATKGDVLLNPNGGSVWVGSIGLAVLSELLRVAGDARFISGGNTRVWVETTAGGNVAGYEMVYPTNAWAFRVGTSGHFVIRDVTGAVNPMTIELGAPVNSIYVDSNGNVETAGAVKVPMFKAKQVSGQTINDDALFTFEPLQNYGAFMLLQRLSGNSQRNQTQGIISYRCSATSYCQVIAQVAARIETTTGALSAGGGNDGVLTISVHTDNLIYFSNRLGFSIEIALHFFHD